MIYRAAIPINVSSTDYTAGRACSAIMVTTAGNIVVDMASPSTAIQSAEAEITGIDSSTGAITSVAVTFGGKNYTSAPVITIRAPYGGSSAVLTANLTSDVVTSITISNAGSGYNTGYTPVLQFSKGSSSVTLAVPIGIIPISVTKVYHTSTTASGLSLLYESIGSTVLNY